jgi:hypothetical protein
MKGESSVSTRALAINTVLITIGIALLCWLGWDILIGRGWETSDALALLQFFITLALIPTVLFAFVATADSFRKAQSRPQLSLLWEDDYSRSTTVHTARQSQSAILSSTPRLLLHNTGNAVALWYSVAVDIPFDGAFGNSTQFPTPRFRPAIGNNLNWINGSIEGANRVTFLSNGQIASYPNVPLPLIDFELHLQPQDEFPARQKVNYTIVTDTQEPVCGSLELHLVPADERQLDAQATRAER